MPIPPLPIELIGRIIHFTQPHHAPLSYASPDGAPLSFDRKETFESLSLVGRGWYGYAKEEYGRWLEVSYDRHRNEDRTGSSDTLPTVRMKPPRGFFGGEFGMERVRFVVVAMQGYKKGSWEREAREVLRQCRGGQEIWYGIQNDVELTEMESVLSFLVEFSNLRTLHLSSLPSTFTLDSHQLSSLRHLTLCGPESAFGSTPHNYDYLNPRHLPNLTSLSLSEVYTNTSYFLSSFTNLAPQLRFLSIRLLFVSLLGLDTNILHETKDPEKMLALCTKLAHFCYLGPKAFSILSAISPQLSTFTTSIAVASMVLKAETYDIPSSIATARLYLQPNPISMYPPRPDILLQQFAKMGLGWKMLPREWGGKPIRDSNYWEEIRIRLV